MISDPLVRMLRLARPLRSRLVWAVLAGAATTGSGIALLAVSGFLIARAAEHPRITSLALAVVAVRALGISRGVFRYAERLATHDVAFRVLADVRVQIYRRLERLAPSGLREFRSGDLLARLVSDVDATQDLFIRGVVPPLAAVLAGGGAVAVCTVLLAPAGALLVTGLLAGGVLVPAFAAFAARRSGQRTAAARGTLAARVIDTVAGAADLRAFGAQSRALDEVVRADALLIAQARRDAIVQGFGAGLGQLSAGLTVWAVLLTGVAAVGQGALGRVPVAVLVLTALAAFEAVAALPAAAAQLSGTRAAARRIGEVLDAPLPVPEPACPLPSPRGSAALRLRDIRVRYCDDEPWALDGIDLDLVPGRTVALVGPSGAGKSTLAALLLRFLDAQEGHALLNGADLTAFAPDDVRRVIGGCPQDPHVFDTTIKENLRLARPEATQADLAEAARRARLLPWIESLPHGWETAVGAHGASLSGGERQRLALARALLADPAILILDEPTAHLDAATSRELMSDLLDATGGKAVLLITHDPIGLEHADEILVLDAGRITERGTHADLIRAGGTYTQLFGGDPVHEPVPI